jgi:two-component system KDP operon response regulator KdpE
MNRQAVILIVDDEPQLLRALRASLPAAGYEVITAQDGEEALEKIKHEMPDLVILDLVMPGLSGLDVCRQVRTFSAVPIIILSAKGNDQSKVTVLDAGADDYVTKPFSLDELLARIRVALRRLSTFSTISTSNTSLITVGDLVLDIDERKVIVKGKEAKLTPKEFEVLKYLVNRAGRVITHQTLLQAVWGWESTDQIEYLRVFINQLRRKIEPDPHKPCYIVTEPWVGYRFMSNE